MQFLSKFKKILLVICGLCFIVACDNNNLDTTGLNPNLDPALFQVTIGPLEDDNTVYVKIPVGVYGAQTGDELTGGLLDIYLNGGLIQGSIVVADYYHVASNEIIFTLSSLIEGDTLGFVAHNTNGTSPYYEGIVVANEESLAALSVADFDVGELPPGEIETFFDAQQSAEGTGTGETYSGTYNVTFDTLTFSEDCTVDLVKAMAFHVEQNMTDEEIADILANGKAGSDNVVIFTQTDGDFVWDADFDEGDVSGIINDDGTFSYFEGDYVDENNYEYNSSEGAFDADGTTFTGTYTSVLVLDGTRLENGVAGTCTATSSFTGAIVVE